MTYTVKLLPPAQRALDRITGDIYRRITDRLLALEQNPRPQGVDKLAGKPDLYRIRVGDWRIVYQIRDKELLILIVKIGHRREIYR